MKKATARKRRYAFRLRIIDNTEAFRALRREWSNLLENTAQESVFLSWEWLFTWWEVFADPSRDLHIIAVYERDTLVGVMPVYGHHCRGYGYVLRWLGTGEAPEDAIVSEYLDIVCKRGFEAPVVRFIARSLRFNDTWSAIVLSDALSGHLALKLVAIMDTWFSTDVVHTAQRYFVPLSGKRDNHISRLSDSRQKRLKRCRRAIERDAGTLTRHTISHPDDVRPYLSVVKALHNMRWEGRRGGGVYNSARFYAFHEACLRRLSGRHQADVVIFSIKNQPAAALHLYYSKGRCHYYQSGFSNTAVNRYMPLFVSHMAEMGTCRARGLTEYDFMRGSTDSYKADFGCDTEPMFDAVVHRHRLSLTYHRVRRHTRRTAKRSLLALQALGVMLLYLVTEGTFDGRSD
ncbi:MAG: GNAT family N-acetyltransferase [Pseudomonadota bacterium]